ncbi:MAG: SIMPL domain-containing protein [Candidatus Sungbacteria bacterium]|nr:SIMPL domain-containing protein [Candidatus Sungbacteria bacterium]
MEFYKNLNKWEKTALGRRGSALLTLAGIFLLILTASYGVRLWREAKDLWGGTKLEIAVSGEGKVAARPDVAKITVSVLTQKAGLREATDENAKKSNAVADYVKKQGVAEKDIRTINYHIYPQQSYPRPCQVGDTPCIEESQRPPKITGYQVRNAFEVTIRDIAKAGDILGGVVGVGVNDVSGITFTIDKPEELQAEARARAIEDARKKAERLATNLGKRVGRMVSFSEGGGGRPIYFSESNALARGGGISAPSPAIEPGQTEITAVVSVIYEFK